MRPIDNPIAFFGICLELVRARHLWGYDTISGLAGSLRRLLKSIPTAQPDEDAQIAEFLARADPSNPPTDRQLRYAIRVQQGFRFEDGMTKADVSAFLDHATKKVDAEIIAELSGANPDDVVSDLPPDHWVRAQQIERMLDQFAEKIHPYIAEMLRGQFPVGLPVRFTKIPSRLANQGRSDAAGKVVDYSFGMVTVTTGTRESSRIDQNRVLVSPSDLEHEPLPALPADWVAYFDVLLTDSRPFLFQLAAACAEGLTLDDVRGADRSTLTQRIKAWRRSKLARDYPLDAIFRWHAAHNGGKTRKASGVVVGYDEEQWLVKLAILPNRTKVVFYTLNEMQSKVKEVADEEA